MTKLSGMEAYTDTNLEQIATKYEEWAAQARRQGKEAPDWDWIARISPYVVVLRTENAALRAEITALRNQVAGKKEPGARQRAVWGQRA